MATRKTNPKAQQTIVEPMPVESAQSRFFESLHAYHEALGVPSERRAFASFCIATVASLGVGLALSKVTTMAMVGAAMLTGSMFITTIVWLLGLVLSIYASIKTFGAAFNYVAKGHVDQDVLAAKTWVETKANTVRGWFRKEQPA